MKQPLFLRQYRYFIPAPSMALTTLTKKSNKSFVVHRPLMKVAFDFENSSLQLESDWHFMITTNKHYEVAWLNYHKDWVFIDATLCPALLVDLNDEASDGFTLPLEGSIDDGESIGNCSGLLTVYRIRHSQKPQWSISCYFVDSRFADCEIRFNLPVYLTSFSE